ncbi:DUF2510 domain-containing protein [Geodermatophilus sp. YIM 151500]|uniref:DUF2510 domain-containing protein n=1 Tax=Geodermatophilus sp. YIM 151500 TaxID=2984531 RepID=UPI0021E50D6A|nr:DUF2510 domain-containing protein [Geodermatophilus sp. YIM 151500]MCV2488656.1 DUF2510 domain-containing protein [Geodermatophilus sp. YIM 151500]
MTVPGQPPPPGWYPDPDGVPGLLRWWHGAGWADLTAPMGPGLSAGPGPPAERGYPAGPPDDESTAGAGAPGAPARRGGRRVGWTLGGVLLVVVGLVVALVVGTSGDRDPVANGTSPSASPSPSPLPSPLPPLPSPPLLPGPLPEPPQQEPAARTPFPPGTERVVDEAAGIAYPYLGEGWYRYDLGDRVETTSVTGQYLVTQEDAAADLLYFAECTSGPVADIIGYDGPDDLAPAALAMSEWKRLAYYPAPHSVAVLRDEPRTVDGRPAHLREFELSWDVRGYEAHGERVAVLLVDVGDPAPALLFVSVPDTHPDLYGVIDRVLEGVDVL